jgi:hypothetical protein
LDILAGLPLNNSRNVAGDVMKQKYPYLAYWKKRGFDKFPTVPPDVLKERGREAFRKSYRKHSSKYPLLNSEEEKVFEELVVELFKVEIDAITAVRYKNKVDEFINHEGRRSLELRRKFVQEGTPREEIEHEWSKHSLPPTKGGAAIPNKNVRNFLKKSYIELVDCIKTIRQMIDVPLTKTDSWEQINENHEDIEEYVPDVLDIFEKKELPLLIEKPSVRDTAIKIIHKRIKTCVLNTITPRTLADILDKTKI